MIFDELHCLAKIPTPAISGLAPLVDYLTSPPLSGLPSTHAMFACTDVSSVDRGVEAFVREVYPSRRSNSRTIVPAGVIRPLRAWVDHILSSDIATCGTGRLSPDIVGLPIHGTTEAARFGNGFGSTCPF